MHPKQKLIPKYSLLKFAYAFPYINKNEDRVEIYSSFTNCLQNIICFWNFTNTNDQLNIIGALLGPWKEESCAS